MLRATWYNWSRYIQYSFFEFGLLFALIPYSLTAVNLTTLFISSHYYLLSLLYLHLITETILLFLGVRKYLYLLPIYALFVHIYHKLYNKIRYLLRPWVLNVDVHNWGIRMLYLFLILSNYSFLMHIFSTYLSKLRNLVPELGILN